MDLKNKKILITGASGFLGQHIYQELISHGCRPHNIFTPSHRQLDLTKLSHCQKAAKNQDVLIHLAAKVGGIGLNQKIPGQLFYDNLIMDIQLMESARKANVKKFVSVGTVCAYPKNTPTPFKEENLWNGYPEETNAAYGLAKKMLLVQGQAYRQQYNFNSIYLLPVNLYGPGDNFDPKSSHVIPALIKKFTESKDKVIIWGTGKATREFLYVKDAARAIVLATQKYSGNDPINIGSGQEISIKKLANLIKKLTNFNGKIIWDKTKPDGQPRRCLDTAKAQKYFGFKASTPFIAGLEATIKWYRQNR